MPHADISPTRQAHIEAQDFWITKIAAALQEERAAAAVLLLERDAAVAAHRALMEMIAADKSRLLLAAKTAEQNAARAEALLVKEREEATEREEAVTDLAAALSDRLESVKTAVLLRHTIARGLHHCRSRLALALGAAADDDDNASLPQVAEAALMHCNGELPYTFKVNGRTGALSGYVLPLDFDAGGRCFAEGNNKVYGATLLLQLDIVWGQGSISSCCSSSSGSGSGSDAGD